MDPISAVGAGVNAVGSVASGVSGKQQQQRQNAREDAHYAQMQEIASLAQEELGGIFGSLTEGAAAFGDQMGGLTEQLLGMDSAQFDFSDPSQLLQAFQFQDVNTGQSLADVAGQALSGGQSYDFGPGSQLMDQTMEAYRTGAAGATANALDAMAAQQGSDLGALDAALASRGISRGSGVAAGALGGLSAAQGQQMAGLRRDLAAGEQQALLQGAQFDVQSQLARDEMQSGYNLADRQFGAGLEQQQIQNILGYSQFERGLNTEAQLAQQQMQSQYDLGFQGMRGDQSLAYQNLASQFGLASLEQDLQRMGLAGDFATRGYGAQADVGMGMANMYGDLLGGAWAGMDSSLGRGQQAVSESGRGTGAWLSNTMNDLRGLSGPSRNAGRGRGGGYGAHTGGGGSGRSNRTRYYG